MENNVNQMCLYVTLLAISTEHIGISTTYFLLSIICSLVASPAFNIQDYIRWLLQLLNC